jgi:hypothetical protein
MKHKHYDMIVASAEGKQIQFNALDNNWEPVGSCPIWVEDYEYRIKPEPKPDMSLQAIGVAAYNGEVMWEDSKNPPVGTIIYALKSAEVI